MPRGAVRSICCCPLWSLLDDEAIASIAEVSPNVVRDHRRMVGKNNGSENTRDGGG
jgi:hypothetical protein